jgi:hypothetical protein
LIELLGVRRSERNNRDDSSDERFPCGSDAHPSPP